MTTTEPDRPSSGTCSPDARVESGPGGRAPDWTGALGDHARWLRTVVRARLGDDQGVDEVIQDVSMAAVAQRPALPDTARLGAWLYQVAIRQALMYRRRRGRQRKLVHQYAERLIEGQASAENGRSADPLQWLILKERDRKVREAVDRLDDEDRELFLLKYTENWSYRELAEHTGRTESAVEARLHRIRQRLRGWLADAANE